MIRVFWFLLLVLSQLFSIAQERKTQDSLGAEKYHKAFESIIHEQLGTAQSYLDSLSQIAKRKNYPKAYFYYHFDLGYFQFLTHKRYESVANFKKAMNFALDIGLVEGAIESRLWLGNNAFTRKDDDEAKKYFEEALEASIEAEYIEGIASSYYGLAKLEKDDEKKIQVLIMIDSIYTARQQISPILANTLSEIGNTYLELHNKPLAREYYLKSLDIAKRANYTPGILHIPELLGEMALNDKDYEGARSYFDASLKESVKRFDTLNIAHSLMAIAEIDLNTGHLDRAQQSILASIEYYVVLHDSISLSNAHLVLSELYLKKKDGVLAKRHLDYAIRYPKTLDPRRYKMRLLEKKVAYLELTRDYKAALESQKELDSLKAVALDLRNGVAFQELERKYQARKKEQEIALLKSKNELAEQQNANQRNLLLAGIGVTTLIGLFFFFLFRNRQKTTEKLREIDLLKSNFFANISHEFRTPLTLISGPLEKRLESKKLSKSDQKDFELMQHNSQRLLNLVDQMLDLSKLEVGKYQLRVSKGNLGNLLKTVGASFQFTAQQKNIAYVTEIEPLTGVWFDQDVVEKVMVNLLSNAFKYTETNGKIALKAHQLGDKLVCTLTNTPAILESDSVEKLFDRFYQSDSSAEGVGIGLSLVRELVQLSKGSIKVAQINSNTLSFTASFPITKDAFASKELKVTAISTQKPLQKHYIDHSYKPIDEEKPVEDDSREILLIVEDNQDVRQFVKESFESNYQVILAGNGKEGIESALNYIPDLVISDIMMPDTDGLELCQVLKNDERTSHIPIVLLTAKAEDEHLYEGISQGADAYITKPFKPKLLQTRVDKLIASRKALRNRYSQEVILKPKDVAITDLDEQFLERVQGVLDAKLTASSFSIQEFSDVVGMSRMQLHRKLKALTGLSASEFVRSQRLKLAASLLQQTDGNVSQIGYQVGFNDPSYFTKCFRESFGISPTEYAKRESTKSLK